MIEPKFKLYDKVINPKKPEAVCTVMRIQDTLPFDGITSRFMPHSENVIFYRGSESIGFLHLPDMVCYKCIGDKDCPEVIGFANKWARDNKQLIAERKAKW
jgi:hypothetical protein